MRQLQAENNTMTDFANGPDHPRILPEAAIRALAEAEARRKEKSDAEPTPKEVGGRDGPEPVRFGDWEKKGIAIDF